ncbi:MAG: hypothetical protein DRO11_05220 [Methanobacteriota archaeon]|nr:MAG: hypothetical protein DRO11_05220 [Euryarchaeota archaeon]
MTKGKIIHKTLEESITASHQQRKQQPKFYHPNKAKHFKREWMTPSIEKKLDSTQWEIQNQGLWELKESMRRNLGKEPSYREIADYLKKYKPSFPDQNYESMRKRIRTFNSMFNKGFKKGIEEVRKELEKNPYLTSEEIAGIISRTIRGVAKEFTKAKIRQASRQYPKGSNHTRKIVEGSKEYSSRVAHRKAKEVRQWNKRKRRLYNKD